MLNKKSLYERVNIQIVLKFILFIRAMTIIDVGKKSGKNIEKVVKKSNLK